MRGQAELQTEVTGMLQAWRRGDVDSGERLLSIVYAELQRIARAHLRFGKARRPTAPSRKIIAPRRKHTGERQQMPGEIPAVDRRDIGWLEHGQ